MLYSGIFINSSSLVPKTPIDMLIRLDKKSGVSSFDCHVRHGRLQKPIIYQSECVSLGRDLKKSTSNLYLWQRYTNSNSGESIDCEWLMDGWDRKSWFPPQFQVL